MAHTAQSPPQSKDNTPLPHPPYSPTPQKEKKKEKKKKERKNYNGQLKNGISMLSLSCLTCKVHSHIDPTFCYKLETENICLLFLL